MYCLICRYRVGYCSFIHANCCACNSKASVYSYWAFWNMYCLICRYRVGYCSFIHANCCACNSTASVYSYWAFWMQYTDHYTTVTKVQFRTMCMTAHATSHNEKSKQIKNDDVITSILTLWQSTAKVISPSLVFLVIDTWSRINQSINRFL